MTNEPTEGAVTVPVLGVSRVAVPQLKATLPLILLSVTVNWVVVPDASGIETLPLLMTW